MTGSTGKVKLLLKMVFTIFFVSERASTIAKTFVNEAITYSITSCAENVTAVRKTIFARLWKGLILPEQPTVNRLCGPHF